MLFRIFIGLTQNTRGNAVCELLQKLGFIVKIQIKRTLCDVRFLYDLIDRGLVNALFKEKLIGRLEQPLLFLFFFLFNTAAHGCGLPTFKSNCVISLFVL